VPVFFATMSELLDMKIGLTKPDVRSV